MLAEISSVSVHRESRHNVANVTEINGFAYFIIAKHGDFCVEIAWRLVTLMSLRFLTNNILGGNNYNYVPRNRIRVVSSCCFESRAFFVDVGCQRLRTSTFISRINTGSEELPTPFRTEE